MAAGQAASSIGGFMAAGKEKEAAAERYKRELAIRRIKWDGQRALYGTRVAEYETEVQENFLKASTAYGNEQARLNSLFEEASSRAQEDFANLMEKTVTRGTGKTGERLEARNLAKFGRNQALMVSNLVRGREAYQSNVRNIRDTLKATNRNAYSKVKFKPQPGIPPAKPDTDMTAATFQLLGGLASAASSGIGAYNSLKAPDVGKFGSMDFSYDYTGGIDFSKQLDLGFNVNPIFRYP